MNYKNGPLHSEGSPSQSDLPGITTQIAEPGPAYSLGDHVAELSDWLNATISTSSYIYIKRLSANDTGATASHQAGVYIPNEVISLVFPEIDRIDVKNPDHSFTAAVDSHSLPEQALRVIYYNGKARGEPGKNEKRITRWKDGAADTPLQDPDQTGALTIFAFFQDKIGRNAEMMRAWVCRQPDEEAYIELLAGQIIPGETIHGEPDKLFGGISRLNYTPIKSSKLPDDWEHSFPTGDAIFRYALNHYSSTNESPDARLMARRKLEFQAFCTIEELHVLPFIKNGFSSVEEFIKLANSVANRRKSRAGKSLELHLEKIFEEDGLQGNFGTQCTTEGKKKPDFIFPSCQAYLDMTYPAEKLRTLAVKTTCKDRWRQILNEADRVENPYLFTLQEGVSENQHEEMEKEGVTLVVPQILHGKFPKTVRGKLYTLGDFILETRSIYKP